MMPAGYWATNCVWLPWNMLYISMYEGLKRRLRAELALAESEPLPSLVTCGAAFTAASAAAVLTHPPDVIKTRIQVCGLACMCLEPSQWLLYIAAIIASGFRCFSRLMKAQVVT